MIYITEYRYTRRWNLGDFNHEEISATVGCDDPADEQAPALMAELARKIVVENSKVFMDYQKKQAADIARREAEKKESDTKAKAKTEDADLETYKAEIVAVGPEAIANLTPKKEIKK